jgi:hypothetical protein
MKYLLLSTLIACTSAFSSQTLGTGRNQRQTFGRSAHAKITNRNTPPARLPTSSLKFFPDAQSTIIIADAQEWRQYVPLIVISGVLLDIVLGNPLANLALAPMKRASGVDGEGGDEDGKEGGGSKFSRNPKERLDTNAVANEALQRARYSMELRRFLDENKTDEQKYAEMRKKIDQQAEDLEDNLENALKGEN